jgi:hypothetical protein
MEQSGRAIPSSMWRHIYGMNEENHGKLELEVVDDPAQIRIIHLPNTSQKSYTWGDLLGSDP